MISDKAFYSVCAVIGIVVGLFVGSQLFKPPAIPTSVQITDKDQYHHLATLEKRIAQLERDKLALQDMDERLAATIREQASKQVLQAEK
jgi:aspartyl/asparaginyl beta-hydroxylase (cupin superfamily)